MPSIKIQDKTDTRTTQAALNEQAKANYNALVVLLASEALKPYAKDKRIELDEEILSLCKAALIILKKDKAAYDNVVESVRNKRNMSLGVIAARQTEGQSEEEIESEESVDGYKSGTQSREYATPESKTIHESFETLLNNTNFAIESLERAVKAGSISLLDAEKAIRCISYTAEPVPRKVASLLYGSKEENFVSVNPDATNRNILVSLAKRADALLEKDLYVVSRRLVLKYYGSKSLDNLDGILRVNELTNETKELGFLKDFNFEIDGESGIRYMTPESLIQFVSMFAARNFNNITDMVMVKGNIANVALDGPDEVLLEKALKEFNPSSSGLNYRTKALREAEKSLTDLFNGIVARTGGGRIDDKNLEGAELRRVLMTRIASVENNTFADSYNYIDNFTLDKVGEKNPGYKYNEGNKPGDLDAIREQYITAYRFYQSLKNAIISTATQAAIRDEDKITRKDFFTPVFPFEVRFPLEMKDLGKKVSLWFETDLTINRINALPLAYIDRSSIIGAKLINDALDERKLAIEQKRNAKELLNEKLSLFKSGEVREKLEAALEGAKMKPSLEGWLKTEELRRLFSSYAREALESIKDITDEDILYKTISILDNSANASIKKDNRKLFTAEDDDGLFDAITPPDLEKVTPSIRFRVLSNLAVTHDIDESVPEDIQAYYLSGTKDNASFYEKIINECADPIVEKAPQSKPAKKNIAARNDAIAGYNKTMELINAIRAAGGGGCRCCLLMDEAEKKAKEIFIKNYSENLEKLYKTMGFLNEFEGNGKTAEEGISSSFMQNYMLIGKTFGEKILFKIAEKVLRRAGAREDYKAVKDMPDAEIEKEKAYEKLSPFAKYVLSKVSIAMVTSSLNKIQKDERYYEFQNSNDSIWYENDTESKTGSLFALTKGTIPYVTEESLREEFKSLIDDYDTARKLSVLAVYNNPEKTIKLSKTFGSYVTSLEKENELRELNFRYLSSDVDVKKAWNDIDNIREILLSWTGTENERAELEQQLSKLSVDNPLITDKIEDFRVAFVDNIDESILGIKKLVDKTDELRYMSSFTYINRKNKNYSREDFIQKEDEYVKTIHIEGTVRQRELESVKNALTFEQMKELEALTGAEKKEKQGRMVAENIALVNISLASIFAPENAFIRELANGVQKKTDDKSNGPDRYEKFGEEVLQMTEAVKNGIKQDCYSLIVNSVAKSFIDTKTTGLAPSSLPKAENVSFIFVPGQGVVSQQDMPKLNVSLLNNEFVNPTSKLDLRDSTFNKAIRMINSGKSKFNGQDGLLLSSALSPVMKYAPYFATREKTFESSFENKPSKDKDMAKDAVGFRKTLLDIRVKAAEYEDALDKGKNIDAVLDNIRALGGKTQYFFKSTGVSDRNGVFYLDENMISERPPEMKYTTKRGEISPVKRGKELN